MYPALGHAADGNVISRLKFKQISTLDGLPTDEVQKIYQDKEGFLWFATRYGFCKYDGYQITVYKSSLIPFVLSLWNAFSKFFTF